MRKLFIDIGRGLYNLFIAITIVAFLGGTLAIANYAVTQGSGTNFGSVVVSTVHYAQQMICDLTTPSQCAAVDSSGNISVAVKSSTGIAQGATAAGTTLSPIGCQGVNAEETAVTNGQISRCVSDLVGRPINFPFANKENLVEGNAVVTSTGSTSLIGVPGSSLFIYVTHVSCFNSGSTGTTVLLQNGSGGTTIWEGYAAASGGAFVVDFPTPIGGVNNMTANTALFFQAGSATTSLICNASGFKGT